MEWLLILLLAIYSSIFMVGFTGNLIMVLVTIHSNQLRSMCNILICACCFCDLLLFTDIIAFVFSMFIPTTQEICFYINIPADFGAFASNACVFVVGIDRLIAVVNPTRYKILEMEKTKYVIILLSFPVVYALFLLYVGFFQRDSTRIVTCLLPESLGHAYDLFAMTSFFINCFVPPIYIYVYYRIKNVRMGSTNKAVFKSLFVTVFLVVGGWLTTDLIGVLTVTVPMDPYVAKMIQLYCGTFIFTSSAFNVVVYYKMCKDYKNAIRAMFGLEREIKTWRNSIRDLNSTAAIQHASSNRLSIYTTTEGPSQTI